MTVMTSEQLRAYARDLPDRMILRVYIEFAGEMQEDDDGE